MKLKIELDSSDLEAILRAEMQRRFPALRLEDISVPYLGRECRITLDDEPEAPAVTTEEAA